MCQLNRPIETLKNFSRAILSAGQIGKKCIQSEIFTYR